MATSLLSSAVSDSAVGRLFAGSKRTREGPPADAKASAKAKVETAASAAAGAEEAKPPKPSAEQVAVADAERLARTIFVGNLPVGTKPKALKRHFAAHGTVENVRLRAAAAANPKMSQRAAVITGEVTGDSLAAYVIYADRASALAAIATSGQIGFGHHLRIDAATAAGESSAVAKLHDARKSVFLGNLPHSVSDEALWRLFESCGRIAYVRVVREPRTQIGKGFGYVGFHEAGSVERALAMHGTAVAVAPPDGGKSSEADAAADAAAKGRPIRVFRCTQGKSHARLTQQPPEQARKKDVKGAAGKGTASSEGGADEQRKGVGWQQRVRRRLHKKLAGKAAKAGSGSGSAAAKGASMSVAKSIMKAASRSKVGKGKGKAAGGGAPRTAKARREAKDRSMAKKIRSKAAKRSAAKSKQAAASNRA